MDNYDKKRNIQGIMQEYVDTETGELIRQTVTTEVIEGYVDVKLPEKHKFNNGNFIVLFQKSMLEIVRNFDKFSQDEHKLLLYLLGTAGIGNSVYLDYPTLIEELKIDRPRASRAVTNLDKKGIIIRSSSIRKKNESQLMKISVNFDQLNYNLAYNGKIKDFKTLKHKHPPISINSQEIDPRQMILPFGE
jgi:hypothetical protein